MIEQAKKWLGKNEADNSHREIIDAYNNITPLPAGYKLKYTDAWCAGFVSACAWLAGVKGFPFECSCGRMLVKLQNMGLWIEDDAYVPTPGDLIFYDWGDTGKGDDIGAPGHVGIVEAVKDDNITIIEGNYGDAVKRRTIKANARYIRGYGVTSKLLPNVIEYTVVQGDTLWRISRRYLGKGSLYTHIMTDNGLKNDIIIPGQKLKININIMR